MATITTINSPNRNEEPKLLLKGEIDQMYPELNSAIATLPRPHKSAEPPLCVMKFGGTSVANADRIRNVAQRALNAQRAGNHVVVVVSAMSGETNRLLSLAAELSSVPAKAEVDVLAATGEQVTAALTSLAIADSGGKSRSFLGHQLAILTDSTHGDARIQHIDVEPLRKSIAGGEIPVVAGFQGVDSRGRITTLGRGGSDTTAVAIAAALNAADCEIYTDVDGVYSADPGATGEARKFAKIRAAQMLALASLGAKVLHPRSVAIGARHGIPIHVRSSFDRKLGSWIIPGEKLIECPKITAVTCDKGQAMVRLDRSLEPREFALVLSHFRHGGIEVERFTTGSGVTQILVRKTDLARVLECVVLRPAQITQSLAKISVIGEAVSIYPDSPHRIYECLRTKEVPVIEIAIGDERVSIFIDEKYASEAVRSIHEGLELGNSLAASSEDLIKEVSR